MFLPSGDVCLNTHQLTMFASNSPCSASPEKPAMSPLPKEVHAGSTINVSCSVAHTCASHPPEFSWSVPNLTSELEHIMVSQGTWKITSIITFMADGGDGLKHLTCTATFWRGKQQTSTSTLRVKGQYTVTLSHLFYFADLHQQ